MRTLCIALVLASAFAGSASAQNISTITGKLPLAQADRPLTMTHGTLRIDAEFALARACFEVPDLSTGGTTSQCATGTFAALGAGYSIIDDFEVGARVLPFQLTDEFNYDDPSAYARFRFISGSFEMAVEVTGQIGVRDASPDFVLTPGLPIRIHLVDRTLRLDTGGYLPVSFAADTTLGLWVPLGVVINATPNLWVGPRTGLRVLDLDAAGDTMVFPLGVWAGYTIPRGGVAAPLADIYVAFDFPFLVSTGPGDTFTADIYTFTAGVNVFMGGS